MILISLIQNAITLKVSRASHISILKRQPQAPHSRVTCLPPHSNLLLLQAMLPHGDKGRNAILAVVEQDDHAVGIHALANQELVVLEVVDDLLREGLRARFELLDLFGRRSPLAQRFLHLLHVCCVAPRPLAFLLAFVRGFGLPRAGVRGEAGAAKRTLEVAEVALLVEAGLLQAEAVGDVEDHLSVVVDGFLAFFGRRVGADVDALAADRDLLAVGFVCDAVDLLESVRVGDDLVAGDDVLLPWALGCEFAVVREDWTCLEDDHFDAESVWECEMRRSGRVNGAEERSMEREEQAGRKRQRCKEMEKVDLEFFAVPSGWLVG